VVNEIVRCPYCVSGDGFRPMLHRPGWFVCEQCVHVAIPDDPDFKSSRRQCTEKSLTSDPSPGRLSHSLKSTITAEKQCGR
jgi:hypothetical protein